MSEGGAERQRSPSRLCIDSRKPHVGLELMNHEIMTWAKIGSLIDWTTQAPHPQNKFCLSPWQATYIPILLVVFLSFVPLLLPLICSTFQSNWIIHHSQTHPCYYCGHTFLTLFYLVYYFHMRNSTNLSGPSLNATITWKSFVLHDQ